uniref:ABC transporter domain-containing protein n=1 Tax=Setaria digitata TaxID=48799 RepID=A0A915Q6Y1_9BILA
MLPLWKQLLLLMWKSTLIRKRQKIWLSLELLVPILLFGILALVRTRNFTETHPICHYDAKAFPSAGIMPFLQSYLCSFSNPCHASPTSGDDTAKINSDTRKQSLVVTIARIIAEIYSSVGSEPEKWSSRWDSIISLIDLFSSSTPQVFRELIPSNSVFNSSDNATEFFKRMLNGNDDHLSHIEITRLYGMQMLKEISHLASSGGLTSKEIPFLCNLMHHFGDSVPPEDMVVSTLLCKQLESKMPAYIVRTNTAETNQVFFKALHNWFKFASANKSDMQYKELIKMFKSLRDFLDDQVIRKLISTLSVVDFSNHTSVVNELYCGNNPFDRNSDEGTFVSEGAATNAYDEDRNKIYNFLRYVTPGRGERYEKQKQFCGAIPVRSEMNCSFLEGIALSQIMPIINGYILLAPASPIVNEFAEKISASLRWISLLRSSIINFNRLAPSLQNVLFESKLRPASKNIIKFLKMLEKSGALSNDLVAPLSSILSDMFNTSSDPSSLLMRTRFITLQLEEILQCFLFDRFVTVSDEKEMIDRALCLMDYKQYMAGIVFLNVNQNSTSFPPVVTYKIRYPPDYIDSTRAMMDSIAHQTSRDNFLIDLKYLTFGFSFLQEAIDKILIENATGQKYSTGLYAQQEPYKCVKIDKFYMLDFLGMFIILSWMLPSALLVKNIVYEKEMRLKEMMRIMGLVSCVAQCVFISTLFSRTNIASVSTAGLFFLLFFPYQISFRIQSSTYLMITLLFPQTTVAYGFELIYLADISFITDWSSVLSIGVPESNITLSTVLLAFTLDTFIYTLLAWYISVVFPGIYGVPQPFYFFITKRYWLGDKYMIDTISKADSTNPIETSDHFEREPTDLKLAVSISSLFKVYENGTKALDNLNMRFYESQITALLGRNGAGKTTAISILTGLTQPTSGRVFIYGLNLQKDVRAIRNITGVCLQHNTLFDKLTVTEHLQFYGALKGIPKERLDDEVSETIANLGLIDSRNKFASHLSGGMKRKLCIGIALIGGSKLLILDEPTAGVDPRARRSIWDILIRNKKGRTVILSTHHMDEADLLADRIAIISEGQLQVAGSSLFLKKKFGSGLYLNILKAPNTTEVLESSLESYLIKQTGGSCVLVERFENEESYRLPINLTAQQLKRLFEKIEKSKNELGIMNYSITAPTLQQAASLEARVLKKDYHGSCFPKLFKRRFNQPYTVNDNFSERSPNTPLSIITIGREHPSVQYIRNKTLLRKQHFKAVIKKRLNESKRNITVIFIQIWIPIFLLLGAEIYNKIVTKEYANYRPETAAPLELISGIYGNWTLSYFSLENQNESTKSESYLKAMTAFPGTDVRCNTNSPLSPALDGTKYACYTNATFLTNLNLPSRLAAFNIPQNCSCDSFGWNCTTENVFDYDLDNVTLPTANIIYDVTYHNISQFRLITSDITAKHLMIGGWQFAQFNEVALNVTEKRYAQIGWYNSLTLMEKASKVLNIDWQRAISNVSFVEDPFKPQNKTFKDLVAVSMANFDTEENGKRGIHSIPDCFEQQKLPFLRQNVLQIWFNNKLWHSLPIFINAYHNAVLRSLSSSDPASIGILTYSHPMNYSLSSYSRSVPLIRMVSFRIVLLLLSVSLLTACFCLPLVEERVSLSKHLQRISGLTPLVYWPANFTFDTDEALVIAYKICSILFMVLPHYNLGMAAYRLSFLGILRKQSEMYLKDINRKDQIQNLSLSNPLEWHLMGKHLVALIIEFFFSSLFLLIIEYRHRLSSCKKYGEFVRTMKLLANMKESELDEDVLVEHKRVDQLSSKPKDNYRLIVRNVSKSYDGQTLALHNVSFAVKKGECFGLLGINGAGKTTMFRILTGQVSIGGGDILINNKSIEQDNSDGLTSFGYCPQFDALSPKLTAREHLSYYALLRGIKEDHVDAVVNWALNELQLNPYADEISSSYSGGNKRKLSVAIALVADPPLLLLDEPSAGMDPSAQRFMWNLLLELRKNKRAMVITSHSMEECEVLCSRVAIMNRGQLRCVGPIQHLKHRFGEGYTLTIRLSEEDGISKVQRSMETLLPAARLEAVHFLTMFYQIPNVSCTIADVYGVICEMQETIRIDDYSLSQTTLDDMFVSFVSVSSGETDDGKTVAGEN